MNSMIHRLTHPVILALLGLTLLSASPAGATPAGGHPAPALTLAVDASATVRIAGGSFIPGGRVFVAVYDAWGTAPGAMAWITASPIVAGPDGTQDPARGYQHGGLITLLLPFAGRCAAAPMVRAYDATTGAWSAVLDADARSLADPVYGPNGSQDPALDYDPGC
jgi:hypothetical protein